ncbi:MAG: hypothetical protein QOC55_2805 [Thermoleophilaceae bacterium]|nr:hypothetical protein [Thermoleophilaceae bacterium]
MSPNQGTASGERGLTSARTHGTATGSPSCELYRAIRGRALRKSSHYSRTPTTVILDLGRPLLPHGSSTAREGTKLQRLTSLDAHLQQRKRPPKPHVSLHASPAIAASAAYLHPIAKGTQVGHILGAAAGAARSRVERRRRTRRGSQAHRAGSTTGHPVLIDVLDRYPLTPACRSRVARFMTILDASLNHPPEGSRPFTCVRSPSRISVCSLVPRRRRVS